jgi:two-component system sensor histidine kinase RegB
MQAGTSVAVLGGCTAHHRVYWRVSDALRRQELEALQFQQRLAHHERLASIATLAAGTAHELGNPLATIAVVSRELELYANEMEKDASSADDPRLIRSEVERSSEILHQMSGREGDPVGEFPTSIGLKEICAQVIEFSETRYPVLF